MSRWRSRAARTARSTTVPRTTGRVRTLVSSFRPPSPVGLGREAKLLVVVTAVLATFGMTMIASASVEPSYATYGNFWGISERQAMYLAIGLGAFLVLGNVELERHRGKWIQVALAVTGLAVVATLHGHPVAGAKRWISVGGQSIQPSEFAKLAVIVWAADFVVRQRSRNRPDREVYLVPILVVAALCGVVEVGHDLGTATLLMACLVAIVAISGASRSFLAAFLGIVVLAIGLLLLVEAMHLVGGGYQITRIWDFFHQGADLKVGNYQLHQAKIALGSGGPFGKGIGQSVLKWGELPTPHADFIFAVVGEETGLLGTLGILATFFGLLVLGARIAIKAPTMFDSLVAIGITTWFGAQVFVNVGSVIGLFPVTGVPLPLISAGGTSTVAELAALGILFQIARTVPRGKLHVVDSDDVVDTPAPARPHHRAQQPRRRGHVDLAPQQRAARRPKDRVR